MRIPWRALALCALTFVAHGATAQTVEYVHTDLLGSPVAITDANGQVIRRTEYAPYGEQINRPVEDGPGFTGHVADATSGLIYMQQRYYDPGIGLFLSTDPVTAYSDSIGQFHRYRYANNNPYKFSDPDGRCARATGSMICGGPSAIASMARTARPILAAGSAEKKSLSGVPETSSSADERIVSDTNKGIEGARRRIDRAKDPLLNGAWNSTEWNWNPDHPEFSNPDFVTAAFVDSSAPHTVNIGRYFGRFANSSWSFDYQGARFRGGVSAMIFAALHEFGHVVQVGVGGTSRSRERAANSFAFGHLSKEARGGVECDGC